MPVVIKPDTLSSIQNDLEARVGALERIGGAALTSFGLVGDNDATALDTSVTNTAANPIVTQHQNFSLTMPGRVLLAVSCSWNLSGTGLVSPATTLSMNVIDDLGNTTLTGTLTTANRINEYLDYSRFEAFDYPAGAHWAMFQLWLDAGSGTFQFRHRIDAYLMGS